MRLNALRPPTTPALAKAWCANDLVVIAVAPCDTRANLSATRRATHAAEDIALVFVFVLCCVKNPTRSTSGTSHFHLTK